MKTYDEIRRILTQDLGFTDLDAYKKWLDEVRPKMGPVTSEMIDRLSPDVVDCRDFWKVCDELFGIDPVCNVAARPAVGALPWSVETQMDANRMNLRLAKSLGVTAFLDEFAHERVKTLEIGAGYGSLKNYIETHTSHQYTGFDVRPRLPGILETTAEGFLPEEWVKANTNELSYVVSSNVFQHLSAKQRTRYFHDARALLHDGGIFIVNLQVDNGKVTVRDKNGNAWADHYGQYTLIPKPADIQKQLTSLFSILYATQRYDGLFNFVLQKHAG